MGHGESNVRFPGISAWFSLPRVIIQILVLLAVTTRLLPLSMSQYPFNNDGLTECAIASDILENEHLQYDEKNIYFGTHSTATPAYNVLLAFASSVLGSAPLNTAQSVVACIAVLTVLGGYVLAFKITGRRGAALAAGLFMGLFGTLVFLTGSTWKGSLGFALFVFLFLAYVKRAETRMLTLEVIILALLPLVHHLATLVAYSSLAYLTLWTLVFAAKTSGFRRRHFLDTLILVVFSAAALAYYRSVAFDRLADVTGRIGLLSIVLAFLVIGIASTLVLNMKKHSRLTFSPVPALLGFGLFVVDYFHPLFPYSSGFTNYSIVLAAMTCGLVSVAWLGLEDTIESRSRYRAIPLGMLLPVLTLFLFAVVSGMDLSSHQVLYRSFDYADLALAMGIAVGMVHFGTRPIARRVVAAGVLVALLITFPFAYATADLVGVRHDTQGYEVDALAWVNQTVGSSYMLQSDERLSYIAMAMYDFEKMPYLPERLESGGLLGENCFYVLEDEWMTKGVNDYPRGHPVLNSTWVSTMTYSSNVWYVGGPESNNVILFTATIWGMHDVFGLVP